MKKGLALSILLIVVGFALLGSSQVYPLTMTPGEGGGSSQSIFYQPGMIQAVSGAALVLIGLVCLAVSAVPQTKRKKH